jgi:single-stranded DNA-specific DHH superfamily exonuclease
MSTPIRIYFHGDTDGCCSAAIIADWLESTGEVFELHPLDADFEGNFVGDFFLDLAKVKRINVHPESVVIDHHPQEKLPCRHFNPRLRGKSWPASYECYLNYGRNEICWIAALGCIGDSQPQKTLDECTEKLFGKVDLNKCSFMIGAFRSIKGTQSMSDVVFKLLKYRKDPKAFCSDKELIKFYEEVENEIGRVLKEEIKIDGKLLIVNFKSKYMIKSQLSNIIKRMHPEKVILISQETDKLYKLSLRQEKQIVDFSQIMPRLTEDLDASGGGHPKASGAKVSKKDFDEFVRRLKNAISESS